MIAIMNIYVIDEDGRSRKSKSVECDRRDRRQLSVFDGTC